MIVEKQGKKGESERGGTRKKKYRVVQVARRRSSCP